MTLGGQYSDRLIDLSQILMTDLGLCFYNTLKKRGCAYFDTPSFRFLQEFSQPSFEARLLLLAFFSSELFPESLLSVTSISLRSLSKNLYSRNASA